MDKSILLPRPKTDLHECRPESRSTKVWTYRRDIGWIVVTQPYDIAVYAIAKHFYAALKIGHKMLTALVLFYFSACWHAYVWLVSRAIPLSYLSIT